MKMVLRHIVVSFVLSVFLYLLIFHIIGISTIKKDTVETQGIWQPYLDCQKDLGSFECFNKIGKNTGNNSQDQLPLVSTDLLRGQLGVSFIFDLIYGLLFLCLFIQTFLLVYALGERKIHAKYFNLSDWAINSPPLLGVLGTIASFMVVVSNSDIQDMQQLFKDNFSIAAITTILGGFIYIINLFFLFLINQYFSED